MRNSISNPFVSCTARDMSYSDVIKYWCSPYKCYKISEDALIRSVTPIVIEGARGSGKTMILKHQSFYCQKQKYSSSQILNGIRDDGYLGVYFRYSADYSTLFDTLNCSSAYRTALFDGYFQLCISLELCKIIEEFESEIPQDQQDSLYFQISECTGCTINNCQAFRKWIEKAICNQDERIRKSQYYQLDESQSPSTNLLFSLMNALHTTVQTLQDVLFIIIIDEYENIGSYQRVINTYIKQIDGAARYTFRIGVRPGGIEEDFLTNISGEFLQDGRDFIKNRLAVRSDDRTSNYDRFVQSVIDRRLETIPIFNQTKLTTVQLLGAKEDYDWEALTIVKNRKFHFAEVLNGKTLEEAERIKSVISDDSPIVEAYYIMRMKRGDSIEEIEQMKNDVANKRNTDKSKKYYLDMGAKYKAALLFWLADRYKAKKMYYSFSTFQYLSCGSIYDFIGLCRTVFDELESDYFDNFENEKTIPPHIQANAARKYAEAQLDKVKINHEYGHQMWNFAQNMCNLFSYYHKGDLSTKYPETNQFYTDGCFENSGINREIWCSLIKWGIVIQKNAYQRASLSVNRKAQLFYVNKLYYPLYNISCRIRGGFNYRLTSNCWDEIIVKSVEPSKLIRLQKKSGLLSKIANDTEDESQMSFF